MLNEAKTPRPSLRLKLRGRGRGQDYEVKAEAEAKILASRPLNITGQAQDAL